MRRLANLPVVLLVLLCAGRSAQAEPAWGVNCLSCHDEWQVGVLTVLGEDTVADPDESITGAPDRGPLPVFQVAPGQVRTLEVEVVGLDNSDAYAVELKRLRFPGVVSGNELAYTDDCTWAYWGEPGKYYTDPAVGYSWDSGPTTFAFDVQVSQDAPDDYYDLVFAVAGKLADSNGLFTTEEHFYVEVTTSNVRGDFDGDGDVDIDDFDVFVECFPGPGGRVEPGCELCDLDGDGDVDCTDWGLFRQFWTQPEDSPEFATCAAGESVPAVSGWGLALMAVSLAAAGTIVRRWRRTGAYCAGSSKHAQSLRLVGMLVAACWHVPVASASDLNVTLEADVCEASTITVGAGCGINYRVIGELSDSGSDGLALIVFDLEFVGGALHQVDAPTELPMLNFVAPGGFSGNPSGYGGTPQGSILAQVGGAQNVFNHGRWSCLDDLNCPAPSVCNAGFCTPTAGLPTGTVLTGVAAPGSPVVLATGMLTAPSSEGTYTLEVAKLAANLITHGATGDPFWTTEKAGAGLVTNLSITVRDATPCCGEVFEACCLAGGTCTMTTTQKCTVDLGGLPEGPDSICEGDADSDGVDGLCGDQCPHDANKIRPGGCGCGVVDMDSDGDTVLDCVDQCPGQDDLFGVDIYSVPLCAKDSVIPTLSQWGLIVLTLLLLAGAKLQFRRCQGDLCS